MRTVTLILALLAAMPPVRLGAQGVSPLARAEISTGYAFSSHPGFTDAWPLGWFAGAAWPATEWLAVSGELANHQMHGTFERGRTDLSMWSALAGVTVSRRIAPSLKVLARGSSGMTTLSNHVYETLPPNRDFPAFDVAITVTAPAVQFGAGADVEITRRISLRTLVEYRRIFDRRLQTLELPAQSRLEVSTGFSFKLGSRQQRTKNTQ